MPPRPRRARRERQRPVSHLDTGECAQIEGLEALEAEVDAAPASASPRYQRLRKREKARALDALLYRSSRRSAAASVAYMRALAKASARSRGGSSRASHHRSAARRRATRRLKSGVTQRRVRS